VRISIRVSPNSKEARIFSIGEVEYEIKFDEKPEGGRANKKLIEILSEHFKVPKSKIYIVKGTRSKDKIVEIILDEGMK
jgi:uncharacterized protein (TIGR00251 family)